VWGGGGGHGRWERTRNPRPGEREGHPRASAGGPSRPDRRSTRHHPSHPQNPPPKNQTGDRPVWYLGAIPAIRKHGTVRLHEMSRARYGPVWKSWSGSRPLIMTTTPADARAVAVHHYNRPAFASVWAPGTPEAAFDKESIIAVRDDRHRSIRAAWLPLFFSGSLAGFSGLMGEAATELAGRLEAAAAGGSVVDVAALFGEMTLQVVGEAAFGISFKASPATAIAEGEDPAPPNQREALICAISQIFNAPGLTVSAYGAALLFAPVLRPVIHFFSARYPDAGMRRLRKARQVIVATVADLIEEHVAAVEAEEAATAKSGEAPATAATPPTGPTPTRSINDTTAIRSGVAAGSFIDVCVRTRDKSTGARLSPLSISNQAFVMLLAGYETTANALSYTAYLLAHPANVAKLRKVQAEVDAFFGGDLERTVTAADVGVAAGGSVAAPAGGEGGAFPYMRACLWESMRLYPPAPLLAREAGSDVVLHGSGGAAYPVKKGAWLAVPVYAMQRDPDLWVDPTAFIPERWVPGTPEAAAVPPHAWMSFGAGPRVCVGWRLAVTEAIIALAHVFAAVELVLEPGQDPLPLRATITMSPKNGVKVRAVSRRKGVVGAGAGAGAGVGAATVEE